MDTNEIQERVNAIRAVMTAKGFKAACVGFEIRSNERMRLMLRYQDPASIDSIYPDDKYEWVHGTTVEQVLNDGDAWVAKQPDAAERKLKDFMGALAKVIDLGKDRGIDVEFMNPLLATMKKLSENALTDQRAA